MTADLLRALGNHMWQTTIFGLCAVVLAISLRRAPAKVRSAVWLAASLKFLLPLSLLIAIGTLLAPARRPSSEVQSPSYYRVDAVSEPFTFAADPIAGIAEDRLHKAWAPAMRSLRMALLVLWLAGSLCVAGAWILRWKRLAAEFRSLGLAADGIELAALRKVEAAMGIKNPIPLLLSESAIEPGIFGLWRARLVWPQRMTQKLSSAQMEAIIAHELAHLMRRDNLAAAIHLAVEAVFWFHPLVWWLHARMMDERERACDEAVVLLGNEPEIYAEGILRACRFSIESPLACVAGIGGSELKLRVRRIVAHEPAHGLSLVGRMLLSGLAVAAVVVPIAFGLVDAPRVSAGLLEQSPASPQYSFEVATVKPGEDASNQRMLMIGPGKVTVRNMPLKDVIMFAYDAKSSAQISGFPEWVNSALYSIDAKEDEATAAALDKLPRDQRNLQIRLMVQALLAERFHLKVSRTTKELPVYALLVAKAGPKLKTSSGPLPPIPGAGPGGEPKMRMGIQLKGPGDLEGTNVTMDTFASGILSKMPEVGDRVVVDKTGLPGHYDFTLRWTPDAATPPPGGLADSANSAMGNDAPAPGLFTALEDQLGLKLESQKGSVETLVVDSIDRPTPN
jgi:bla regulator protein blaR1